MAPRSGRFGRLPRAAADLSGALVAMMREYAAKQEQNIVDAWKNGGSYTDEDGVKHKATDAALLKFFDDKVAGLDPSDPLYDEAKNTRLQYKFAVDNSKMELKYARHQVSDGGMAAFYAKSAREHPHNSEIYRSLMKLSAQYHDRGAAGRSAGRGRARANKAAEIETPKGKELAYTVVTNFLLDVARQRGIVNSGQSLESATQTTGEGFGDLQVWQGDFGQMAALINEVATSPEYAGTREALTAYIRKWGDKNFDGNFTMQGILAMGTDQKKGLAERLKMAQKDGTKTQVRDLTKQLTLNIKGRSALGVVDPLASLEEHHAVWSEVINDPKSSPLDIYAANEAYRAQVTEVYGVIQAQAANAGGSDGGWLSVHAGRLYTELKALSGDTTTVGATLYEESRGQIVGIGGGDPSKTDAYQTAEFINENWADIEKLRSGAYVLMPVSDGKPSSDPADPLRPVSLSDVKALGVPVTFVPTESGSLQVGGETMDTSTILTVVTGTTITTARGGAPDASGRPTSLLNPAPGTRDDNVTLYTFPDGVEVYGVYDSTGVLRYSTDPPFIDGVTLERDGKGVRAVMPPDTTVGASTFNPADAIAPVYKSPETVTEMNRTTFRSAITAYETSKPNFTSFGMLTDEGLQAALWAESGGNEQLFAEKYQEAINAKNQNKKAAFVRDDLGQLGITPSTTGQGEPRTDFLTDRGVEAGRKVVEQEKESRQRAMGIIGLQGDKDAPDYLPKQLSDVVKRNIEDQMKARTAELQDRLNGMVAPQPPPVGGDRAYQNVTPALGSNKPGTAYSITPPKPAAPPPKPAPGPSKPSSPPPIKPPPPPPPPPKGSPNVNPATGFVIPAPVYAPPPDQRDFNH